MYMANPVEGICNKRFLAVYTSIKIFTAHYMSLLAQDSKARYRNKCNFGFQNICSVFIIAFFTGKDETYQGYSILG